MHVGVIFLIKDQDDNYCMIICYSDEVQDYYEKSSFEEALHGHLELLLRNLPVPIRVKIVKNLLVHLVIASPEGLHQLFF